MEVKSKLEEDAVHVLQFMASNGLIANQAKTEFMVLNKNNMSGSELSQLVIGDTTIQRTTHTKLLGMIIEDSQEWTEHFKHLKCSLNQRLFVIRRVTRQIPSSKVMCIVHSLWVSKLRYGLQLCTKVRLTNNDSTSTAMKSLQLTQNRLLRALNNTRTKDRISIKSMLDKFGLLSVNQLAAKIKLVEVWKSTKNEDHPFKLEPYNCVHRDKNYDLRPIPNRIFNDSCRLKKSEHSFHVDAARLWNAAPIGIINAPNLNTAKKLITTFCQSLPV